MSGSSDRSAAHADDSPAQAGDPRDVAANLRGLETDPKFQALSFDHPRAKQDLATLIAEQGFDTFEGFVHELIRRHGEERWRAGLEAIGAKMKAEREDSRPH